MKRPEKGEIMGFILFVYSAPLIALVMFAFSVIEELYVTPVTGARGTRMRLLFHLSQGLAIGLSITLVFLWMKFVVGL